MGSTGLEPVLTQGHWFKQGDQWLSLSAGLLAQLAEH